MCKSIYFSLFCILTGFQRTIAERSSITSEIGFEQTISHPNAPSENEPDTPFVPSVLLNHADPHDGSKNCICGTHDHPSLSKERAGKSSEGIPFDLDDWIITGNVTDRNQYPWVVALVYRKKDGSGTHFCGGTLITNKLVLTATHCFAGKNPKKTEVWLNERELLLSSEAKHATLKIKVDKLIVHPEYNSHFHNDISLLELSEPVDIEKSYIRTVCLPKHEKFDPIKEGIKTGITAGWGSTYFNGPLSERLLHTDVPLLTNQQCTDETAPYYKNHIHSHVMCAGDLEKGGKDACPGDSGGPLFIKYKGRYLLVGIVSWGDKCGEPRKPGVYTRVAKYIPWIEYIDSKIDGSDRCKSISK